MISRRRAVKRALMARAAETIVLATNEKLGAVSPFHVAPVGETSTLVVAPDAPGEIIDRLAADGATTAGLTPAVRQKALRRANRTGT